MLKFHLAKRYIAGKKSTNAIHVITGISMLGLSVGTAAMIIILSVFNGFQDLLMQFFSNFNPEIKVSPAVGKNFVPPDNIQEFLEQHPDVRAFSYSLEDLALFEYQDRMEIGILKGVDDYFGTVSQLESVMQEGRFELHEGGAFRAVLGAGMARKLRVNVMDRFAILGIYTPDQRAGRLDQPFKSSNIRPVGTFAVHHDVDQEYVLAPLEFVRELFGEVAGVSALEIALHPGASTRQFQSDLSSILGEGFLIKDRYQQDEAFYRIMQIEKWVSFAIISLTLVLVAFNLIGALWMIVLEKKRDISILKAMGADRNFVKEVFLLSGLFIGLGGMIVGIAIALVFYWLQVSVGLIPIPPGFVVDSYPISLKWYDFVIVSITVSLIAILGSIWPALKASAMEVSLRSD
ncbi:MAG: ABC transporter permease [Saprospirales bacterium]|nr:MAG: ABC transporter permease [Saprospirales bacterium]